MVPYTSTGCSWGTSTSVTGESIWARWVLESTTTVTTSSSVTCTNATWYRWIREESEQRWLFGTSNTTATTATTIVNADAYLAQQLAEVRARDAARREREAAVRAVAAEARGKADRRAKGLLVSFLSDAQRKTLEEHGYFDEHVPGHGTFRIHKGWAGNVQRLDVQGKARETFCIHPVERISDYDNMLSQRLLLRTDPDKFMRTANRRPTA